MKYLHILKELYGRPVLMTHETFETCHKLIQSKLDITRPKFFGLVKPKVKLQIEDDMEDDEDMEEYPEFEIIGDVAYIDVIGVIGKRLGFIEKSCGACDINDIQENTRQAMNNPMINTVVYNFDSGGGGVSGIPETAEMIAGCGRKKKTLAFIDGMCGSAAYWLASSCNEIYATPSSQVGSIGVYCYILDESKAYEKEGIEPKLVKAGKNKGEFLPGLPIEQESLDNLQTEVDAIYKNFTGFVSQYRSISNDYMQGRTYYGEDAQAKGFVDILVNSINDIFISTTLMETVNPTQ